MLYTHVPGKGRNGGQKSAGPADWRHLELPLSARILPLL